MAAMPVSSAPNTGGGGEGSPRKFTSSDELQLEHAFLKCACEGLTKTFRARHKAVHRELQALGAAAASLPPRPSRAMLDSFSVRLDCVRRTLASTRAEEVASTRRCSNRVRHLSARNVSAGEPIVAGRLWDKTRVDRMLADYMLRGELFTSARLLAETEGIQDLVDLDVFEAGRVVSEALRKKDCAPALKWCAENKRRLNRIESTLEFRLHLQEVVELARRGERTRAISYVRMYLTDATTDGKKLPAVQHAMALLAFGPSTECEPYRHMYSTERWPELIEAFRFENLRLHGLPLESGLETSLKAGLASLKTHLCGTEAGKKPNCPTCCEPFSSLAKELPRSQHVHSVLVCAISSKVMDEDNPPMMLPNGNVYSNDALVDLAATNGVITDPRTNETFSMSELRKCFIM